MSKHSDNRPPSVREKLIGLGEKSIKKSHYPELKARMHQMERFHALLDEANDAIVLAEAGGLTLVDVNATACRLLGKSREEMVGAPLADLLPPPQGERLARFISFRDPDEKRFPEIEARFDRPGGTPLDVGMTVTIHTFDERDYVVVVARDVSERKAAEDRVRKLNQELEERVKERTDKLNRIISELDAFTYSVSHDLRAPLRIIEGFSRILEEDYAEVLDGEGMRLLGRIINSVHGMDHLITDLLHLSRVNRKELEVREVDLGVQAREVYGELTQFMRGRNVHFTVADNMAVQADSGLTRVLLSNLVSNALKFTAREERAKIEVGVEQDGDSRAFFVRDNGVGFDSAYVNDLFAPFKRLHSANDFEGTGIGLAIVKRVAERHGGRVWGEGEPGRGATMHFTLEPE